MNLQQWKHVKDENPLFLCNERHNIHKYSIDTFCSKISSVDYTMDIWFKQQKRHKQWKLSNIILELKFCSVWVK